MKRLLLLGLVTMLVAVGLPGGTAVLAQEDEEGNIILADIQTMFGEYALTVNNEPLQVCQYAWESLNRWHNTCEDLVSDVDLGLTAGLVTEQIFYDGTLYTRENDAQTWSAEDASGLLAPDPLITNVFIARANSLGDFLIVNLGAAVANDTDVTHFQLAPSDGDGSLVYDLFVDANGFVIQDGFSFRVLDDNENATSALSQVWAYSHFNTTIVIDVPPPEVVVIVDGGDGNGDDGNGDDGNDDDDDDGDDGDDGDDDDDD